MKLIWFKIVPLLVVVMGLTAAVLGICLLNASKEIVIEHELVDLSDETNLRARELQSHLYGIRSGMAAFENDAALTILVSEPETFDEAAIADRCHTRLREKFKRSLLRGEIWQRDAAGFERLAVLPNDSRSPLAEEQDEASIADIQVVLEQIATPNRFDPFLSNIGPVAFDDEGDETSTYAIWCGVRVSPDEAPQPVYVAALVDLLAPLGEDTNAPLTSISNSSRHLAILANSPPTDAFDSVTADENTRAAVRQNLVFLNHDADAYAAPGPGKDEPWLEAFSKLFQSSGTIDDNSLVQSVRTLDERDASQLGKVRLEQPFLFAQSEPVYHAGLRQAFFDKVNDLNREHAGRLHGARIGMGGAKEYYFRVLAGDKTALDHGKDLISEIATALAEQESESIRISWKQAIECSNCNSRYAMVPVRSAGLPGNQAYRYYGVAYSAFQEEMEADVWGELSKAWITILFVAIAAALIGLIATLMITRPLKQITLAAEAVGRTSVESASDHWQQEIDAIGRMLPADRNDEIGVLARALQQMITGLLAGQFKLQRMNTNLDRLVAERTDELQKANKELQAARDKADELNRAKDAFLASVSHELRNPLNQVSGFCQLLELTELDDEQRSDLRKIRLAGGQLSELINDILDYQKIVMGGITLEPEPLDVAELLGEIRDAMKFLADEHSNELRVEWSENVGTIHTDRQRLRQVLLNLAGNACKFTNQGSVHIHAERISRDEGDDEISISVADTGRGMSPEEQARLFMPFTKLAAKQGNRAGTGLGLVISKGFSELMGGNIHVASEFGKGSTFTVQIPETCPKRMSSSSSLEMFAKLTDSSRGGRSVHGFDPPSPDESTLRIATPVDGNNSLSAGHKVLVIDDDVDVREMMVRYLGKRGFDVRTAASGMEGLELAKKLRPVAITLDAIMPGLDGWAVLAALKADHETADVPVIMVTMVDNRRRGQIMGADEYIVKPIEWPRLLEVLERLVTAGDKRSLLVVDDDEPTREMLRRNLQQHGWSVLEAEHGAAALDILAVKSPAAILLDLMMPVMDGFEFLNRQAADARGIPIIVVTAKDPTPEEFERLNGRAARVLLKGHYTQEELLQEICRWVDTHVDASNVILGDKQNA